jgi:hypothetical protein
MRKIRVILLLCLFGQICKAQVDKNPNLRPLVMKTEAGFNYESCGCEVNIDLRIHNGLGDSGEPTVWGGQEIADEDEVSLGAVTVVNWNDTDGDTTPDFEDMDGVVGSSVGRDELDLMKLIINIEGDFPQDCEDQVVITYGGDISFYLDYRKETPYSGNFNFSLNELPTTLFVESRSISAEVGDISIIASLGENIHDEVRATGIWIERSNVFSIRGNNDDGSFVPDGLPVNPDPWVDLDLDFDNFNPLISLIEARKSVDNSRYGFGNFPNQIGDGDCSIGGRILFEYQVLPNDIRLNDLNVKFDIGRRRRSIVYRANRAQDDPSISINDPWPVQVEDCNDDWNMGDNTNADEDREFSESSRHFYSFDGPSSYDVCLAINEGIGPNSLGIDFYSEFQEFVRVGIGESDIFFTNTDAVLGSRASYFDDWSIQFYAMLTDVNNTNSHRISDLKFQTKSASASHSEPIFLTSDGIGNGDIHISYPSNIDNGGYTLYFFSGAWFLYRNQDGGGSSNPVSSGSDSGDGNWSLTTSNGLEITISTGTTPWSEGALLYFNTFSALNVILNSLNVN